MFELLPCGAKSAHLSGNREENMTGRETTIRVRPRLPASEAQLDKTMADQTVDSDLEVVAAQALQALAEGARLDRRGFMRGLSLAGALAGLALGGCAPRNEPADPPVQRVIPTPAPRLRAAFSHNGLKGSWNARGRDTSQFLGRLLGIDVVNYDGEFNVDKQRQDLDEIAEKQWDFVAIHPAAVNAYIEPVQKLIGRGIPVIDMDTRLADDLLGLGVVTFLEPDNLWMGEQVTQAIVDAVQSESQSFEIIHTQGQLTHTGAQGRARGFRKVIERYPGIRVVDETPGDWDADKTSAIWDDLLERYPNVRAGFCHNDDMALAALRSVQKAGKQAQVIIGGVDGMQPACAAVERGDLVATAINPTGRIHGGAIWIGYFLATRGKIESVPKFIRMDGGIVNRENAEGYYWLGDHLLI
jgi:ribose transport system substrate-binding protein